MKKKKDLNKWDVACAAAPVFVAAILYVIVLFMTQQHRPIDSSVYVQLAQIERRVDIMTARVKALNEVRR